MRVSKNMYSIYLIDSQHLNWTDLTHSLRTPSTRFSIKKDPITINGTKNIQLNVFPTASFA